MNRRTQERIERVGPSSPSPAWATPRRTQERIERASKAYALKVDAENTKKREELKRELKDMFGKMYNVLRCSISGRTQERIERFLNKIEFTLEGEKLSTVLQSSDIYDYIAERFKLLGHVSKLYERFEKPDVEKACEVVKHSIRESITKCIKIFGKLSELTADLGYPLYIPVLTFRISKDGKREALNPTYVKTFGYRACKRGYQHRVCL